MNTNNEANNSKIRVEQVAKPPFGQICLGIDLHKKTICLTRIVDGATPEHARTLSWEKFWEFVQKQPSLAQQVYAVYEAGAFGFGPCRKLQALGVTCWVIHPEKLDPRQRRVQNDRLDALHLALKLQRYVGGNRKAMTVVYVPTVAEETDRLAARHRDHLSQALQALQARGRGLLLSQGIFQTTGWDRAEVWERLQPQVGAGLARVLEDLRQTIAHLAGQLAAVEQELVAAAPKALPKGLGRLTFTLLLRLLCNYERFKNRRQVAGFTGLCGGVSSSGDFHMDLSINKAGNPRLRTLLVELAWRLIYHQPHYRGLRTWHRLGGPGAPKRRRKMALVATARHILVDLWRWQTGRASPEQLGWQMITAA